MQAERGYRFARRARVFSTLLSGMGVIGYKGPVSYLSKYVDIWRSSRRCSVSWAGGGVALEGPSLALVGVDKLASCPRGSLGASCSSSAGWDDHG